MFNDKYGLTDAVLKGRKTMTRRLVKQSVIDDAYEYQNTYFNNTFDEITLEDALINMFHENLIKLPYKIGEIVAVAQSYETLANSSTQQLALMMETSSTFKKEYCVAGWNNKMFVKADLMPHQIRITNVKLERLQDISDEDCLKEGVVEKRVDGICYTVGNFLLYDRIKRMRAFNTPQEAFAALIDKLSGKGTWDRNPWVFAYSFELVK